MIFRRSASHRSRSSRTSHNDYQPLEPRQMLTVDLGLNATTGAFDPATEYFTSDINGDIGPNHVVQVLNNDYSIRGFDGGELFSQSLEEFFGQTAGADLIVDIDIGGNEVLGTIQDARIIFDHDSQRWFASSVLADQNGNPIDGNQILLAISRTSNPFDGFRSVQFVGDTTGAQTSQFATLAVDGNGVLIATNNEDGANTSSSIFAIPKVDLLLDAPTIDNLARFENLDDVVVGSTIQFATDLDGETGSSYALAALDDGTSLSLIEITGLETGDSTMVMMNQSTVTVPAFTASPGGRQPNAVAPLGSISPDITGNAVSQGGFLWTVHTVEGSSANSAIRWYQIDEATHTLVDSGDIEDPEIDFINPSIAVNPFGAIAIGFTGSGPLVPGSSYLQLGFTSTQMGVPTVQFPQDPQLIQFGSDNFVRFVDGENVWGETSATRFDPNDPFSFFTFQQYVSADDAWSVTMAEASIDDIAPVITTDNAANEVRLRRSDVNDLWAEVLIDGVLTDVFEMASLDGLNISLGGGSDTLIIDNTLGTFLTELGMTIDGGAGTDTLQFIDSAGHVFDITGDGAGTFDQINTFSAFETLIGGDGDDIFNADDSNSDWMLIGGAGNDLFDIRNGATGTIELMGEAGDDVYRLPLNNFASISVVDSSGFDILVGQGTTGDDTLLVNNETIVLNGNDVSSFGFTGIEQVNFDGIAGDDTFNIQAINSTTIFSGGLGDDLFNISSDAPVNDGSSNQIAGQLTIDGGTGNNRMVISSPAMATGANVVVTTNSITGLAADPAAAIRYFGAFGGIDDFQGIELIGSDAAGNNFDIRGLLAGNSLLAVGGGTTDAFNARAGATGNIFFDGRNGSDIYRTSQGDAARTVSVFDSGDDFARDRFSIRTTDLTDLIELRGEQFDVDNNTYAWDSQLENLVVDTRGGTDEVTVFGTDARFVRFILGTGNDTALVNGTNGIDALRFDGQAGRDSFRFEGSVAASIIQALGGDGDDTMFVGADSFARSKVDGQAGDDNVEIVFASRDSRRINARDTGSGGNDTLTIFGTPAADRLELRSQVIDRGGEIIVYSQNTELLSMNLLGSADIVDLFGASAATFDLNTGTGNDTLNVHATATPASSLTFNANLSAGNDNVNVFRVSNEAQVNIFGQNGNDNFSVGSSRAADNGNLSHIRGGLFLGGGADTPGFDTLQVNDRNSGDTPFEYTVADTFIAHSPGPFDLTRPFDRFNFSTMEFVFLSGNDARNTFNVLPSFRTLIRVDGNNNPTPDQFFGDMLNIVGNTNALDPQVSTDGSEGFVTFANGAKNVSFEQVERMATTFNGGASNFTFDPSLFGDRIDLDSLVSTALLDATEELL